MTTLRSEMVNFLSLVSRPRLTLEPVTSDVSVVLSFLQEMLDKQRSPSTIKVYAAAIAAFHTPVAGRSVARDSAVIQYLGGAKIINPPRLRTVLPWDLPTVLRALRGPPSWAARNPCSVPSGP